MRTIGPTKHTESFHTPPDTVGTVVVSVAATGIAQDYPTGAQLMRIKPDMQSFFNPLSTSAVVPSTNEPGTTESTGRNIMLDTVRDHYYSIPSGSTGFSINAATTGLVHTEFWMRGQ